MPRYWTRSRWLETDWSRVVRAFQADYARIVRIAKGKVGFIEPMLRPGGYQTAGRTGLDV